MKSKDRKTKRLDEEAELAALQKRLDEFGAADESSFANFADLPISQATLRGLKDANFVAMTDVQKKTIVTALKGEDVMATAKTGLGKTLAFLVPLIESLFRNGITEFDGLAALVISPTRELAVQIFEVLKKIGRYNAFSAGLVTGGKDVQYEKERVGRMNILVGTPGRLAQHFNETVGLETSNLQVLVLDEADRCLDMGFKKQLDSILGHLTPERQTLLFSATALDSVADLARLSLSDPRKIAVSANLATPETLEQYYVQVRLEEKLDVLWLFIKLHLKSKVLVFFSSLKQVQYAYESFRTLQPGISLLHLFGRHKQATRLETTAKFTHAQYACLFATDIVARGLDFPAIDWVVQVDCPEDSATYVHRVGRSARFGRPGKSLLMLTPGEAKMLERLEKGGIAPKLMTIKQKSKRSIRPQLQLLCFKDPKMKNLGQRAFIAYYRLVYVQKDKDVFDVGSFSAEKYAELLGLPGAPQIKIKGGESKSTKNALRQLIGLAHEGEEKKARTKYDRMFERQNQTVLLKHYLEMTRAELELEDDFMTVKRQDHELVEGEVPDLAAPTSKRSAKRALSKKQSLAAKSLPTKLVFDDDGEAHPLYELEAEEDFRAQGDARAQQALFVEKEGEKMGAADEADKAVAREKRQEKKRRRKEWERRMAEDSEPDIEQDMESSDAEPAPKRWFHKPVATEPEKLEAEEVERPETLEDLEALTARLIH